MDMKTSNLSKGWKEIELGDALDFVRNGVNIEQKEEGEFPITRIETIWNSKIDKGRVKYCNPSKDIVEKYSLLKGDILFSHINSPSHIGKTAIYEGDPEILIHGINLLLLRSNKKIIFPKYLDYFLKSKNTRKYFEARCKKAVNQASLNQQAIKEVKVPLPPLQTQKKIVQILEQAEQLKQKREQADELMDDYLKSVFNEMFLKKDFPLEEIGKICDTSSGGTPSRANQSYWDNGTIPWIKSGDLNKNQITGVNEFITEEGLKNSSAKYIEPNTVLIAMYGATAGKSSISRIKATTNQAVCAIVPKENNLDKTYLLYWLRSSYDKIVSLAFGGGQPNISQQVVRLLKIPLPPIALQKQFASIVEKVEKIKEAQKNSKQEIDNLFNALMQQSFRGEIKC